MGADQQGYVAVACERAGVTEAEWDELAQRASNVFATSLWLDTWHRHVAHGRDATALSARADDGRLIGLLPLVVQRRRPRVLLPAGLWPPPSGPVVCAREDLPQAAPALAGALAREPGWDVAMAAALPVEAGWRERLRTFPRGREHNRVAAFGGQRWDEWLASRSSNFRRQVRQRERRLAERYDVRYRCTESAAELEADLDTLFRLHDIRFGDGSTGLSRDREAFHREVAAQALARGWLRLWLLELDGRPAAANLDLRFGDVELNYQVGRDPAYEDVHAGMALVVHTMRAAADDGVREFHFLRGDQEYKRRLATDDRPVETLMLSRSLIGDVALGAFAAGRRALALRSQRLQRTAADADGSTR